MTHTMAKEGTFFNFNKKILSPTNQAAHDFQSYRAGKI